MNRFQGLANNNSSSETRRSAREVKFLITELFFATEDVVAAGRLADAVDANIVSVRAAAGAIDYLILEQVVSARLFHSAVQATTILHTNCWKKKKNRKKKKTEITTNPSFHFPTTRLPKSDIRNRSLARSQDLMNVGFTSGVFRDPFDIGWKSLDVEVVAVEIGALLLSEIGSAYWAFLDITRSGRNNKHQFDLDTSDSGTRDSPITDTFSKAKSSTVRRCGIIAVPCGSLDTSAASARASPNHPSKKIFLKKCLMKFATLSLTLARIPNCRQPVPDFWHPWRGKFRADTIDLFRKPFRQPKAYVGFGNLPARRPTSCTTIAYKVADGVQGHETTTVSK